MKKFLIVAIALVALVAVTVPASALEVKYGGLFRARVISQSDFPSFNVALDDLEFSDRTGISQFDHLNRMDQRLRLFMYFIASENLRVVTKFEANTHWGDLGDGNVFDVTGGGNVGADVNNFGVKNAYLDFAIPNTPARAFVGVQGIALLDSWIVDDDFSAALVQAKFDPVKVTVGYISGQNFDYFHETENIDDAMISVDYASGPFKASLIGFYQNAHDTTASVFPMAMTTPVHSRFFGDEVNGVSTLNNFNIDPFGGVIDGERFVAENNQLFDLGVNLGYKMDFLSAYVNFVKNFGSVDLTRDFGTDEEEKDSYDYTGWMIDAGVNYFCGPYTFNVGGFYTSGQELERDGEEIEMKKHEIQWFTYPLATSKYFSEIMGGGILDNAGPNGGYWRGYPMPFNIWTVTAGAAWQVLPQTKLSASYWYFGTSEDVPSEWHPESETWDFATDLGHEFDFYLTQGIVDKLTLDLVGAYMITGDAFRVDRNDGHDNDDDTYELGARLQWSF